jgi:hypothetical protein
MLEYKAMPAADASRPLRHPLTSAMMLLLISALLTGCAAAGWLAQGAAGNGKKKIKVKAQYHNLENKRVAVMVCADEYTLFEFPGAPLKVSQFISGKIASNIPGTWLMNPREVIDFQNANPYWATLPYGELIRKMDVERLVIIDLVEYRTHEPGNSHVWQGVITGNVGVVEAEAADPDNFTFYTTVHALFPEESKVGMLNSDDETVELGMLATFARDGAGLFYDHEVIK